MASLTLIKQLTKVYVSEGVARSVHVDRGCSVLFSTKLMMMYDDACGFHPAPYRGRPGTEAVLVFELIADWSSSLDSGQEDCPSRTDSLARLTYFANDR